MFGLDDIVNKFFGSAPVVDKEGTTYGPAQARISRTPIEFTKNLMSGPTAAGEYEQAPGGLSGLLAHIPGLSNINSPQIRVNPNSPSIGMPGLPGNVGAVVRHEQAHALMDKLPNSDKVASHPVEYMPLVRPTRRSYSGDPTDEVPAYAVTQPSGQMGQPQLGMGQVPAHQQDAYVQALLANIARINPAIAAQMQRLRSQ